MGFARKPVAVRAAGWADDIGRRGEMEDGFVFVDQYGGSSSGAFFAVYDGHGGRQVVDYVIRELHDTVLRDIRRMAFVADALSQSFQNIDQEIRSHILSSGCAACVCVLHEERHARVLYTAHLGDSRAVMCRGGTAVRLTSASDHKATDAQEGQRVVEAGGQIINDRVNGMLAMTRALGDCMLKKPILANDVVSSTPDISAMELSGQDSFVIVACDGLWDVLTDQQAVEMVNDCLSQLGPFMRQLEAEGSHFELVARILVEEALARGSSDNISCVVVLL